MLDKWHRGFLRRGPLDTFHACRECLLRKMSYVDNTALHENPTIGFAREPNHEVAGRFPIRSLASRVARKLPTFASFQRCRGQRDDTMRNTAVSVLAQPCSFSRCRHSSSCIPHRTVIMIWWASRCLQRQKTRLSHGRFELR